jgi:Fe2+ or Zn2+ uptake regulation protein
MEVGEQSKMASLDLVCEQLRSQGRRITSQRQAIIQVLLEGQAHPTADQIFTQVESIMPDMSPATVYNTLHELTEVGLLLELDMGQGERRYDINTSDHAHLVCVECGHIEDVFYTHEMPPLPPEHAHGFQIIDRRITFRGYCSACASKQKSRSPE